MAGIEEPQPQRRQACAQATDIGLPLTADVEHHGVKGDGDGEPGKDEIGGVIQRIAEAAIVDEGAFQHHRDRGERILAERRDNQAANAKPASRLISGSRKTSAQRW